MRKNRVVVGLAVLITLSIVVGLVVLLNAGKSRVAGSKQDSSEQVSASSTKNADKSLESGDSFNTDDLDTGIQKEQKSTAGLGMGAYDETEASTEASEPETYAETDADGKNLTEPAQTIPTVEQGLSASEYGQIAESVQQQNNAAIADTSSDGSVGKDVNDAISAIQDEEYRKGKELIDDPEFQKSLESYWAEY